MIVWSCCGRRNNREWVAERIGERGGTNISLSVWQFASEPKRKRKRIVEYLERQAIAARYGQTETVRAYSFVITESEEERLWHRTHGIL